jgi:hypothetical protein
MSSEVEVAQNLKALAFEIDPILLAEIDGLTSSVRNLTWASGRPENSDG